MAELLQAWRLKSWLGVLVAVAGCLGLAVPATAAPTTSTTSSSPTTVVQPGTARSTGFGAPLPIELLPAGFPVPVAPAKG